MTERGLRVPYNGIDYRSRAEATWACVFDGLGWTHQYEPKTLTSKVGGRVQRYKPDFLVNDEMWVEVKGSYHDVSGSWSLASYTKSAEWTRRVALTASSSTPRMLLVGAGKGGIHFPDLCKEAVGRAVSFALCAACGRTGIEGAQVCCSSPRLLDARLWVEQLHHLATARHAYPFAATTSAGKYFQQRHMRVSSGLAQSPEGRGPSMLAERARTRRKAT